MQTSELEKRGKGALIMVRESVTIDMAELDDLANLAELRERGRREVMFGLTLMLGLSIMLNLVQGWMSWKY